MRSARDRWSFSKLDDILESMAESRIYQEEATARTEVSDDEPISQHAIGVDVPDPDVPSPDVPSPEVPDSSGCSSATVEPAPAEVAAEEADPADEPDASVPSEKGGTDRCKDNVDDTFDRVACRLSKVRHGDVRRSRLKWMAVGLLVAIPLAGGAIGGMAVYEQPDAPFAWVKEQVDLLLGTLREGWKTDESASDQSSGSSPS